MRDHSVPSRSDRAQQQEKRRLPSQPGLTAAIAAHATTSVPIDWADTHERLRETGSLEREDHR